MKSVQSIKLILFSLIHLLFYSSSAFATASTHIWAPSTDIQPYLKWHITSDLYLASEKDSQGNRPDTITNLGLTVGILPFEKLQAECGFDHKTGLGELDDYPMYFNAKVGIPEGSWGDFSPALAMGIYDLGTKHNKTDYNIVYGKIAKTFSVKGFSVGRFSGGYFYGNPKLLLDEDNNRDNKGAFFAWERVMSELSEKLWVCLEYMGTRSSYGTMNLGFSYKFTDTVSALVGYNIYNNRNLVDTITLQLDIDF